MVRLQKNIKEARQPNGSMFVNSSHQDQVVFCFKLDTNTVNDSLLICWSNNLAMGILTFT